MFKFSDDSVYYVIYGSYKRFKEYYEDNKPDNYWLNECVSGSMDVSKIHLKDIYRDGLLVTIENVLSLTSERNIAMTIYNLAEKFSCTPIEFINKISKHKHIFK